jgi:hypothetical protein
MRPDRRLVTPGGDPEAHARGGAAPRGGRRATRALGEPAGPGRGASVRPAPSRGSSPCALTPAEQHVLGVEPLAVIARERSVSPGPAGRRA